VNVAAATRRHPILSFYGAVQLFSWLCFAVVVGPKLARGGSMQASDAFVLFPLLVISVAVAGVVWTSILEGRDGRRALVARLRRWRVGLRWYAAALVVLPVVMLVVLGVLSRVSAAFAPGYFVWGILFGLFPGVVEEIGWTGYLLPQLQRRFTPLASAVLLGLLWACWHLPVINFLGAAGPHGRALPLFFVGFAGVLTAVRILMTWIYAHTGSVLPAQLMHASSTGSLVLLSPSHIAPADEAFWYILYALALWAVAAVVVVLGGGWGRLASPTSAPVARAAIAARPRWRHRRRRPRAGPRVRRRASP
jgi:membrane protease YdiL (CAAX protease family)